MKRSALDFLLIVVSIVATTLMAAKQKSLSNTIKQSTELVPPPTTADGAGSGSWAAMSDRNVKSEFRAVDADELLSKLATIPMTTWRYNAQDPSIRHIGPMAQDFYAAFGVGEDDKHITTIDADGVALAAVQALARQVAELKAEIERMKAAR